jgi:NAD(P)-dependent dehydrogenase (short-subunit alcohol dehydrogenase family)
MTDSFKTLRMVNPDLENLPERFFLSPEEVAGVVQYLLGPASEVIRGQTVVADKGVSNRLIWPSPPG